MSGTLVEPGGEWGSATGRKIDLIRIDVANVCLCGSAVMRLIGAIRSWFGASRKRASLIVAGTNMYTFST